LKKHVDVSHVVIAKTFEEEVIVLRGVLERKIFLKT
jgi:hypothetical protein